MGTGRYVVTAFLLKNDNQRVKRLFRFLTTYRTGKAARAEVARCEATGVYLYAIAFDSVTLDEMVSFGDPEVEDNWVDTELAKSA